MVFLDEVKTIMSYTSLARTFWAEVIEQEEIMK